MPVERLRPTLKLDKALPKEKPEERTKLGLGRDLPGPDISVDMTQTITPGEPFGTRLEDLSWIDSFIMNVRSYIRVRLEDGVLIKMPTEVYQLNRSGLELLERSLRGESINSIATSLGSTDRPERIYQIHAFYCDVRDLLSGSLGDRGAPGNQPPLNTPDSGPLDSEQRGSVSTSQPRMATNVSPYQGSFTRFPVLSEIAITYRCNLACTFCYAGCGTPEASPGNAQRERHRGRWMFWQRWGWWNDRATKRNPAREEMTRAEIFTVIDQLANVGKVPSVSFTGGECTLRNDLPDLIAHARYQKMRVNIITNGVACASRTYVDQLVAAGLTSAQVSLEGPNADVHDRLTQRPGSFDKTLRGIKNLHAAGLHVHTNTTICEENADHLNGMIDLAKSLDLPHISMNHIIPTGTPNLKRHQPLKISYTRIGQFVLGAKAHAERVGIDFHWYSPTPFCIFNPIAHGLGNKGCAACDGLVHVSPSGEVLPCSSFARSVGNVLEEGLDKIWFGKEAQWYKKKRQAHPICKVCTHFDLCQGACTLYWSSMGYGELIRANRNRAAQWFAGWFRNPKGNN